MLWMLSKAAKGPPGTRRRFRWLVVVLVCLVLIGCAVLAIVMGGSGSGADRVGDPQRRERLRATWRAAWSESAPVPAAQPSAKAEPTVQPGSALTVEARDFGAAKRFARCQWEVACGRVRDVESCVGGEDRNPFDIDGGAELERAVQAGEIVYDGVRAAAAMAQARRWPCDQPILPLFLPLMKGKRQRGEPCWSIESCAEGLRCAGTRSFRFGRTMPTERPGRCVESSQSGREGQPCMKAGSESVCFGGAICDRETGLCREPDRLGAPCRDDDSCAGGAVCRQGRCVARGGEGAACGGPDDPTCAWWLFCADGGQCRSRRALGARCSRLGAYRERFIADRQCFPSLRCRAVGSDGDGVCDMDSGEGGPCEGEMGCAAYLRCEQGRCREPFWPPWVPLPVRRAVENLDTAIGGTIGELAR